MPKRIWKNHGSVITPEVKKPIIFSETDRDEIKRLWKRSLTHVTEDPGDYCNKCFVCLDNPHGRFDCPWLKKIPDGAVPGPGYDVACSGCGRIGETCCQKGSLTVFKRCGFCARRGHWFWEDKCPVGRPGPHVLGLWMSMKKAFMEEDRVMLQSKSKNKKEDDTEMVVGDEDKELEDVGRHFMELTTGIMPMTLLDPSVVSVYY